MGDAAWMGLALELAENVRLTTSPRPWVGCVIVSPQGEVFKGATDGREGPHAEHVALSAARDKATDATLYTTLEPCAHHGKTPPCVQAIIQAGIKRVVVALLDPDQRVNGQGIRQLRQEGIETSVGVCEEAASKQLRAYLTHRQLGRPFVTLKLAATLDARVALADGTSQWITGPQARADAHWLRAEADAVLVGANTARADNPSLTVREAVLPQGISLKDIQPQRFVLGKISDGSNLSLADPESGIFPAEELAGDLRKVLAELADRDILSLLVEGGPVTAAAFHHAQLVDRYIFYLAPALAGGNQALPLLAGETASKMSDLWRGEIVDAALLGGDLRLELAPKRPNSPLT